MPNYNVKNSIIRYFEVEKAYIIYTDDGSKSLFTYFEPTSNTIVNADFTSANIMIYDMKIVDKYLYFCGETSSGGTAVFGFFEIYQTFFSAGPINILYAGAYSISGPGGTPANEQLKRFLQMEVQFFASNDVHIYMIADANYYHNGTVSNNYRCVVDVWETGTGGGTAHTNEQFSGVYFFNDLAITDNYLVVVGDKHGGTGQYMHNYALIGPSTLTTLPLPPSIINYWSADAYEYYPVPEVRVTHIHDDVFAVACHGVVKNTYDGIIVSIYQGVGNLIDRILISDPYNTTQIRDLDFNYDVEKSKLYLIPEFNNTTKRNSQYVIDVSSTYHMTGVTLQTPLLGEVHSMVANNHGTEVCGKYVGELHVWETDFSTNQCVQTNNVPFQNYWFPEPFYHYENYLNSWKYYYNTYYPIVSQGIVNIICK